MSVYFIKGKDDCTKVKIGYSKNVKGRLKQIQYMSPIELEIVNIMDGDIEIERKIHQYFSSIRLYGEWFKLTPELDEFIKHPFVPKNKNTESHLRIVRSPESQIGFRVMSTLFSNGLTTCNQCGISFLVIDRRDYEDQWEFKIYTDENIPNFCPICGNEL